MQVTKSNKVAVVLGAGALVVAGSGTAFALWSATGSGDGSAKAYSAQAITATAVVSPTATTGLYPGGTAADLSFTLANPNPYGVSFSGWSGASITSVSGSGCAASDFDVVASGSVANSAGANATAATGSLPAVLSMKSTAGDNCQGVTVKVGFTLTGGSQV
jgi:hypothetical protein